MLLIGGEREELKVASERTGHLCDVGVSRDFVGSGRGKETEQELFLPQTSRQSPAHPTNWSVLNCSLYPGEGTCDWTLHQSVAEGDTTCGLCSQMPLSPRNGEGQYTRLSWRLDTGHWGPQSPLHATPELPAATPPSVHGSLGLCPPPPLRGGGEEGAGQRLRKDHPSCCVDTREGGKYRTKTWVRRLLPWAT